MKLSKIGIPPTVMILLSNVAFAAYEGTYNKQDVRVLLFDLSWEGANMVIGVFGLFIVLFILYLIAHYWIQKKLGHRE